ncbi:nitrite reductase small subunit NirD [Gilvimarinus sp. SDUM040013]|uniref:Nitrite reductase small subunit NirD n=1 Tax=Gilvimarinus gilvus TaxID=3058038 RepID=A0ABU4RZG7_9GAMM|nr:nitrite reductase small subunit NirD [Gilvimarinus sp. SDUM040013]MDO3388656.1 nitrite reductase small subunit NirD [Gilvimarinus sp. SDUM040013]MDX6849551.1 nitrite reductase small subunit NirD [Gilvimarinus sp. SDUM040013]
MTTNSASVSEASQWVEVCRLTDLTPDTGVCALIENKQIALFYSGKLNELFAIDNFDPIGKANVLSRGIIGSQGDRICVASPLYKQHFDLKTGECLEEPEHSVAAYAVKVEDEWVSIAIN